MNNLLVISDLHLSQGESSQYEDFFYEKEFTDFLKYHQEKPTTLVLNGDFIDFLQIVETSPEFDLTEKEKKYGMNTTPEKSVWKLKYCIKKHNKFFKALGEFLEKGNKIVHVKGNHDVEFYWPQVRNSFYQVMENYGDFSQKQIQFEQWFYYEPGRAYIEHGNQYDTVNSFCNFLHPVLPFATNQIELPLGSFYCRYLFNRIESIDPFADNIKPATKYLGWVLLSRPQMALKILRYYLPAIARTWDKSRLLTHTKEQIIKLEKAQTTNLKNLANQKNISFETLQKIDSMHAKPVLESTHFFLRAIKEHLFEQPPMPRISRSIKNLLKVPNIIFGHTHYAEQTTDYINEGTWTPVIIDKKLESVKSKKLTYAILIRKKAELREWS